MEERGMKYIIKYICDINILTGWRVTVALPLWKATVTFK